MKTIIFSICLFLVSLTAFANEEDRIEAVVQEWNSLHNGADVSGFLNLYKEQIYFYGKQKSREESYQKKKQFITNDFSQEIVGSIDIHYYKSGIIKCEFTKKTTNKSRIKEYFSYLLLEKKNGRYTIVGESDYQTDQKLGAAPALGEEKIESFNNTYIGLTVVGLAVCFLLWKRQKANKQNGETVLSQQPEGNGVSNINSVSKSNTAFEKEPQARSNKSVSELKGIDFEKYVVERFSKIYFALTEWRGDKYHDGVYPESSHKPDLEYHFRFRQYAINFAVECKWRKSFINGEVEWAKEHQLSNYKRFEREHNCKVFLVLGVGGEPAKPETVFTIPLQYISATSFSQEQLKPYRKNNDGNFFFDAEEMKLK